MLAEILIVVVVLMLLGALNWTQNWYRAGHDDPATIARHFVGLLRTPVTRE